MSEYMEDLDKVSCEIPENKIEVRFFEEKFLKREPIPAPIIDEKNKVLAFASSYYVLKKLNISPIVVKKI